MLLTTKVKPNAKENTVIIKEGILVVKVNATPENGKASKAVVTTLALFFGIPKSYLEIISGHTNSIKKIGIDKQYDEIVLSLLMDLFSYKIIIFALKPSYE